MLSDILNSDLDPKLGNRIIVLILRGQTLNIEIKVLFAYYTAVIIQPIIQQLKHIYHHLIYPYISYKILVWGSVYKTHIKKIQVKQNQ